MSNLITVKSSSHEEIEKVKEKLLKKLEDEGKKVLSVQFSTKVVPRPIPSLEEGPQQVECLLNIRYE